jgi:hypothetical protein
MSWRDTIKIHPATNLLPMMSEAELRILGEDIKRNGLRDAIVLWREDTSREIAPVRYLLDGRNRLDAMELVGLPVVDGNGDLVVEARYRFGKDSDPDRHGVIADPYDYVISANLHRRHLTAKQKCELLAELLVAQPGKSDRQIAQIAKVSDKTVGAVRRGLEGRSEIPHVEKRIDTKGRKQQAHKPAKPVVSEPESKGEPRRGGGNIKDDHRKGLDKASEYLGVPAPEILEFVLFLGWEAFNRKFQSGLTSRIEWWLVEMHSKYPDTFNVYAWEGSCGGLSIENLYSARGIPVGKYREWEEQRQAAKIAKRQMGQVKEKPST